MKGILPLAAFAGAVWLTGRVRHFAVERQLLDIPNDRSSHTVATPTGGGLAIVVTALLGFIALALLGVMDLSTFLAISVGGAGVAILGFVDDRVDVPARWRLLGHFIAAAWVVAWLGGLPPLPLPGADAPTSLGWLGSQFAILFVVWLLNLTNFMDGIDGIAAVEVITVCVSGAVLYAVAAPASEAWQIPLLLAAAAAGFLVWNWPPAKIFMGDTGSGFLGLGMATLALQAGWVQPRLFMAWVILLGVFVADATVTLIRRVARGEKFYHAHRSHAYQNAAQAVGGHRPVTIVVGLINVVGLFPIALVVATGRIGGLMGLLLAYTPLVVGGLYWRAGSAPRQPMA